MPDAGLVNQMDQAGFGFPAENPSQVLYSKEVSNTSHSATTTAMVQNPVHILQKRAELKEKSILERKEFNGRITITGVETVS